MAQPAHRESASIPRIDPAWDLPTEAELPFDDGQPLPDGDFQRDPLSYALYGLREHFAARTDVAVQGDMFLHYLVVDDSGEVVLNDKGQPVRRMVAPDVYVTFGVPNRKRNSFVTWDEGKMPDFVLEVLSFSTWRHDISAKKALYQRFGVPEFWVADPVSAFVEPPVQGYRLVAGVYTPIEPLPGNRGFGARCWGWSSASRTDSSAYATRKRAATFTTSMEPPRHYDKPKPGNDKPKLHGRRPKLHGRRLNAARPKPSGVLRS